MYPYRFGKCVMPSVEGVPNDLVYNERFYSADCCSEYKRATGRNNCNVPPIEFSRAFCHYACPTFPIPKDICNK